MPENCFFDSLVLQTIVKFVPFYESLTVVRLVCKAFDRMVKEMYGIPITYCLDAKTRPLLRILAFGRTITVEKVSLVSSGMCTIPYDADGVFGIKLSDGSVPTGPFSIRGFYGDQHTYHSEPHLCSDWWDQRFSFCILNKHGVSFSTEPKEVLTYYGVWLGVELRNALAHFVMEIWGQRCWWRGMYDQVPLEEQQDDETGLDELIERVPLLSRYKLLPDPNNNEHLLKIKEILSCCEDDIQRVAKIYRRECPWKCSE